MTRAQKYRLVILLTSLWVAVIFAPILFNDFRPPAEVNAGLPTLIGALLAVPTTKEENRGDRPGTTIRRRNEEGGEED
jgi:hypothetical protein